MQTPWRKSAYNPKSRYPVYHIGPETLGPGPRFGVFCVMLVLSLLFVWRWTTVEKRMDAERAADLAMVAQHDAERVAFWKTIRNGPERSRLVVKGKLSVSEFVGGLRKKPTKPYVLPSTQMLREAAKVTKRTG